VTDAKGVLEHAFAETAKGNGRPFIDMLANDVKWEIIGSTDWSRTFHGKQRGYRLASPAWRSV
jgi:uncharacterized protein